MTSKDKRIFLSPPHMGGEELELVKEAFVSNYIAPLGPQVDAFENEFCKYVGVRGSVAVSSGTAAMHLALRHLGVGSDDEVFASTLTFIGSVTPVVFEGAVPVFIDCDRESWGMDPGLLEDELERCEEKGKLPRAVVPTDLYGQCCDLGRIVEICDGYGVPVVCDSAEAMGARFLAQRRQDAKRSTDYADYTDEWPQKVAKSTKSKDGWMNGCMDEKSKIQNRKSKVWKHAGVGARAAVYSFNGNKIITTSGGGMLASDDGELIEHARKLSQQAREGFPHYEHVEIGYNYRMSNVLAAIGRGQLKVIEERVKRKREIFEYYRSALGEIEGIEFMPEPEWSRSNRWLTVVLIRPEDFGANPGTISRSYGAGPGTISRSYGADPGTISRSYGAGREKVRLALEAENIEARPVWKPMHLQPVFNPQITQICADYERKFKNMKKRYPCRVVGGEVAEDLFERGLCLPSGTAMTEGDLDRVIEPVLNSRRKRMC